MHTDEDAITELALEAERDERDAAIVAAEKARNDSRRRRFLAMLLASIERDHAVSE